MLLVNRNITTIPKVRNDNKGIIIIIISIFNNKNNDSIMNKPKQPFYLE